MTSDERADERTHRGGSAHWRPFPRPRRRRRRVDYAFHYGKGCVNSRINRDSGARHSLFRPKSQSDDDGWLLICDTHGYCVVVETRRRGEQALAETDWCECCHRIAERRKKAP